MDAVIPLREGTSGYAEHDRERIVARIRSRMKPRLSRLGIAGRGMSIAALLAAENPVYRCGRGRAVDVPHVNRSGCLAEHGPQDQQDSGIIFAGFCQQDFSSGPVNNPGKVWDVSE